MMLLSCAAMLSHSPARNALHLNMTWQLLNPPSCWALGTSVAAALMTAEGWQEEGSTWKVREQQPPDH